jgi:hypothetical protein
MYHVCYKLSVYIKAESTIKPEAKKRKYILHPLSIWAVLGKLHHHLPPVYQPP